MANTTKVKRKMIGGQLLYDAPGHCSFCAYYYMGGHQHRVLIADWFEKVDLRSQEVKWEPAVIRICTKSRVNPEGCSVLGLEKLLKMKKHSRKRLAQIAIAA